MKRSSLIIFIIVISLFTIVGCTGRPGQVEASIPSESDASFSTETVLSSSDESVPESDGATLWLDFVTEMERQGVMEDNLKTLENSGLPQAEIMEMTAQEILAKIEEIRAIVQENKMDVVRELLADWGLAANDEQFVYVSQSGTQRLELVEELIAAVEREDSASIMGVMMGNPMPIVFELIHEPGEALTLWKHTDVYGAGEVESTQTTITTIYDCALFYQFTDADGVAFSFPKGSLTVERPFEEYTPGDDLPDAQVTAAEAIAAAEKIRPLYDGYAVWRAEDNLPQSFSLYGRLIPESYIEQAQPMADDDQRAVIEGAAVIAGEPFYEVYFYQEDQFNGNAYYIGANDAGLIYSINMVDGMPIPVASHMLRMISCSDMQAYTNNVGQVDQAPSITSVPSDASITVTIGYTDVEGTTVEQTVTDHKTVKRVVEIFSDLQDSKTAMTPKTGSPVITISIKGNGATSVYRLNSPQKDGTLYCKDISQSDWLSMTGWKIMADPGAYDYLVELVHLSTQVIPQPDGPPDVKYEPDPVVGYEDGKITITLESSPEVTVISDESAKATVLGFVDGMQDSSYNAENTPPGAGFTTVKVCVHRNGAVEEYLFTNYSAEGNMLGKNLQKDVFRWTIIDEDSLSYLLDLIAADID